MGKPTSRVFTTVIQSFRRNWRAVAAIGAIVTDGLVVFVCFAMASLLVNPRLTLAELLDSHYPLLLFSILIFTIMFTGLGLYRVIAYVTERKQWSLASKAYFYSVSVIMCTLFLYKNTFYSRDFLLAFFLLIPIMYSTAWLAVRYVWREMKRFRMGKWNTLLVGPDHLTKRVARNLEELPELGYDVRRTISAREDGNGIIHVRSADVEKAIREDLIEMIILSSSHLNGSFELLERFCREHGIQMSVLSPESDDLFNKIHVYDLGGIPVVSPGGTRVKYLKAMVKRAFDVVMSAILLVVMSPVFLLIAIATKLESPGPVFFTQDRALSDHDTAFKFYKFRSMYHAADEIKESLVEQNETTGALFKIKNDPRLTRVGRLIRKHSLDELPQLYNVLRGDMSLVGPRPLPVRDFVLLDERDHLGGYFRNRTGAKPGMTGLWQVSGRSDLGFREMVLLDLYYIEHQTLLFDIEILLRTIPAVLFGRGAY